MLSYSDTAWSFLSRVWKFRGVLYRTRLGFGFGICLFTLCYVAMSVSSSSVLSYSPEDVSSDSISSDSSLVVA